MLASGVEITDFDMKYPDAEEQLGLDCNPSDVPQVKPRLFTTWCNLNYQSTFAETVNKVKAEAVEFFYQGDTDGADAADAAAAAKAEENKKAEADRIKKEKEVADAVAAAAAAAKAKRDAEAAATAEADVKRANLRKKEADAAAAAATTEDL